MSQQMEFNEAERNGPQPSYGGYHGSAPQYNDYATGSYTTGQKLSAQNTGQGSRSGQRLALAIVSIVMFAGAFIAATAIGGLGDNFMKFMAVFGLVLFAVIIIVINSVFSVFRH